ncbi:hypothetical protein SAMN06272735_6182 [Streptomyces sp. TLI_55]|uniref:hypothetical protein n=1 Tax=Streptomyces sp. TLI_55 TaxID=1938861 RepID=UPI000BCA399C|nr:hypothetical protein [Streptomyces sp. TLI_55]SNX64360.1 hypothetical protein SAMN06272735_6182 [Streptomyces sp. TLI_55]
MPDEAQTPDPSRDGPTPPPPEVSLGKPDATGETSGAGPEPDAGRDPWAPPRPAGEAIAPPPRDTWASPTRDAEAMPTVFGEDVPLAGDASGVPAGEPADADGPGGTLVSDDPLSWPPPSVHDQRTVTSMPGVDGTGATPVPTAAPGNGPSVSQPWANPFAAPGNGTANAEAAPFAPPADPASGAANPFAPPTGPSTAANSPTNPFAPPSGPAPVPFTSPSAATPPNPFAPPTGPAGPPPYVLDAAVPPPPIAPEGPGQVPYGYPGSGYGYPGQPQGYPAQAQGYPGQAQGYPGQPQGYYGWPGMQPLPANGMGTAGLVLGILSAIVFCLWPVAIVLGVLGVIFGSIGRGKASKGMATNAGQALAGIICGAAGIVLGVGMLVLLLVT